MANVMTCDYGNKKGLKNYKNDFFTTSSTECCVFISALSLSHNFLEKTCFSPSVITR